MIQELNDMRLDFFLPVPLNQGCKLSIFLPEQYSVDTIHTLTSFMAFGSRKDYTETKGNLKVNVNENKLMLEGACETYIDDNMVASILIRTLK